MQKNAFSVLLLLAFALTSCVTRPSEEESAWLFSYFTDQNSGLRLAYSYDGLTWTAIEKADGTSFLTPVIGDDRLMRDPSICQGPDGTFHLVWTSSWTDRIIGYASSTDLVHWSEQKAIPVMMHEAEAHNCWAPELYYDAPSETFYIFWATTIPGRHGYVAESENEQGNHRIYVTTTKDFQTFTPTEMFFDQGFSAIDAAIVCDPRDGSLIMTVKNENPNPAEKNIRVCRRVSAADGQPVTTLAEGIWSPVSEPIHGNFWAEGPSPYFVGDTLYVIYDCYRDHRYGISRSTDGGATWQCVDSLATFPRGIRHGTVFPVKKSFVEALAQREGWE